MVKKIILVFKTHFDIGFTDLASRVIHGYGNEMLSRVIETCNATAHLGPLRYVWTMPAWPLWHITQHCAPEQKGELDRLIREGQIVWHALPFTSHTDFCAPEEYVQGLKYSALLAQTYGKPLPIAAKMTDVPGHGQMLPEILSQSGIRFLHLGCNEFATPPQVPELFFWRSPAGGEVLTMYSKGGYGTDLLPPENWPYPVWMALMHTHDNCGPQSGEMIQEMARKAQEAYPQAEVLCGTMDDFYRELAACDLSAIPVVDSDLADTWIHGVGSYPREASLLRESRVRARKLHSRYLTQLLAGNDPQVEGLWEQYYENVCLFEEHTWGADVKTWLGPDRVYEKKAFSEARNTPRYRFMEQSWQEQRQRAQEAAGLLDAIEARLPSQKETPRSYRCQVTEEGDLCRVENHRYALEFDTRTGKILHLLDKKLCARLLESQEGTGVFQYRYDRYGLPDITEFLRSYGYHFTTWGIQDYGRENYPDCAHRTFTPKLADWSVEDGVLSLRYRPEGDSLSYGDSREVLLTIAFPEREEELEVALSLSGKEATAFVESGSFVFPLPQGARYRIGRPGGIVDPSRDIVPCANHALYCLEQEVTVLNGPVGLRVASLDAPLFGIGETGVYTYHKDYQPLENPGLWFSLFNNMWGTNFPQWIEGDLRFRFVLRGCAAGEADCAPAWAAEWDCELPQGIQIPQGMQLVHVEKTEGRIYLTLRDLQGQARRENLTLGGNLRELDLQRRPKGPLCQDRLELSVRPYGLSCIEWEVLPK